VGYSVDLEKGRRVLAIGVPSKRKGDHVRLVPPGTLFCTHCGEKYAMALPVCVGLMAAACDAFSKEHRRCKLRSTGPACTYCFTFGHHCQACPSLEYKGSVEAWWHGRDTGMSSKTLCAKLTSFAMCPDAAPLDPDDFGRCHRFLKAFPQYRSRILEMRSVEGWAKLADAWDELEALYEAEYPSGRAPKLYARMRELRGDK